MISKVSSNNQIFSYNPSFSLVAQVAGIILEEDKQKNYCSAVLEEENFTHLASKEYRFEESVIELLINKNLDIKQAAMGVNKAPVLYDADRGKPIAIFKEHGGWLTSVCWGDVLAYRLDHDSFANVPLAFRFTHLSEKAPQREHFLSGNFVQWIENARSLSGEEQLHISSQDRQAIAILDMRLSNADRNAGNILIDEKGKLIPIDHDLTFYTYKPLGHCYADEPLSEKSRNYILSLDLNRDIEILREFDVKESEIENFIIRTVFLKLAAESSIESPLSIGLIEEIIKSAKLPTGAIGVFFDTWIYTHSLKKILASIKSSEPYSEKELKEAFLESFKSYRESTENGTSHSVGQSLRGYFCKSSD